MSGHRTLQSGDLVAGRYRIEGPLGHGGFGVVYRATQLGMGRVVALKTLIDESFGERDGVDRRARFRHEAELAQRLEHPNTVRLYDFGETEDGIPYIVLELLKGSPLDAVLAAEGRLSPARAARIGAQTLKALMEAHALGIVHRDIKPSNIFLCEFSGETDFVKVLDFGIAKDTLVRGTGLTPEGSILGTPAYMAPEQVRGSPVAPQTDLYALGMVLAELLIGAPVYASEVPLDVIKAHLSPEPVPLPRDVVDSPLGPIIARATQKAGSARFASAAQMLAALEDVMQTRLGRGGAAEIAKINAEGATVLAMEAFTDPVLAPRPAPAGGSVHAFAPTAAQPVVQPAPPPIARTVEQAALAPAPAVVAGPAPKKRGPLVIVIAVILTIAGGVGVFAMRSRLGLSSSHVLGASVPPVTGHHFAQLTNKQIRARIEAAGQTILEEKAGEPLTQFVLVGIGRYVHVVRSADAKTAQAVEASYLKVGGTTATARDGTCVIHVELHNVLLAHVLLDQLTR